jgi:hypothetical protein
LKLQGLHTKILISDGLLAGGAPHFLAAAFRFFFSSISSLSTATFHYAKRVWLVSGCFGCG